MFQATWSWLVPLVGALAAGCLVLLTTPPGFAAIGQVLFVSARGPSTDAAAYAVAAAASLGLAALVVLAAICGGLEFTLRRLR